MSFCGGGYCVCVKANISRAHLDHITEHYVVVRGFAFDWLLLGGWSSVILKP